MILSDKLHFCTLPGQSLTLIPVCGEIMQKPKLHNLFMVSFLCWFDWCFMPYTEDNLTCVHAYCGGQPYDEGKADRAYSHAVICRLLAGFSVGFHEVSTCIYGMSLYVQSFDLWLLYHEWIEWAEIANRQTPERGLSVDVTVLAWCQHVWLLYTVWNFSFVRLRKV